MNKVIQWMKLNNMYLHDSRTKLTIMITSNARKSTVCDFSFVLNGILMQNSETIKCLGLTIDNALSWVYTTLHAFTFHL
jgi:hypothetical protein